MPIATLANIEKTFGDRVLFDQLNLSVDRGERVGLIGANGAGKTSLFKMLVGQLVPDVGVVAIPDSVKVGYLSQNPTFTPGISVIDETELAFSELHDLAHRMRDLEHAMGEQEGDALDKTLAKYTNVQHEFDLAGGYVWHHKLEATLLGVGLGRETWEQPVETLSGGQRSRLALARLLISEPELLLLDEPTNHLDLAAVEWLENYLNAFKGAIILISHDRFLLDKVANRICWLTRARLNSYPGNYSSFVVQRDLQELSQARAYEQQQADIEKQKEFIRRFGAGQRSKEAKGREKRLTRLLRSDAVIQAVDQQTSIQVKMSTDQRAGDQVLTVRELSKGYDNKRLWTDIGFHVKRGERIGIIGPNGAGKTTLLEVLLGKRDADGGAVRWGANLNLGYYDQQLGDFDPENTILDEVAEGRTEPELLIRNVLAMFLFRGDDIYKTMRSLSGGEKARVRLTQLLLDKPNVLIMDEPTNHLDIASCEALEGALRGFEGTIICVSHDRYFLDKSVGRLLVIEPPNLDDFDGNYSAWTARQHAAEQARKDEAQQAARNKGKGRQPTAAAPPKPKPATVRKPSADNAYARPFGRLAMKDLERQIADTELALGDCQAVMAQPGTFREPARGQKKQAEYDALAKKLEQLEAEYFAREQ